MKRILAYTFTLGLLTMVFSCQNSGREITLSSMLDQMTQATLLSEHPDPAFTLKQFSSYDQRSVAPGQDGWFANHDASWFIRTEENAGRREFVMFDAEGPGAIVRFWMTFGNEVAYTGTLRIYLDASESPVVEGPVLDLISGGLIVGAPLSSSVSPETNYYQRGHNLYLPIPYSQHCKVTYECEGLNPEKHSPSVYYNINYRTWEPGTSVKTFSMEDLATLTDKVTALQKVLEEGLVPTPKNPVITNLTGAIEPGNDIKVNLDKKGAIYKMSFSLQAESRAQALRSTVIKISFDGNETVWSPIGDFFGSGYKTTPYATWHTRVDEAGTMSCYWTMPYREGAEVSIVNMGEEAVEITSGEITTAPYKWTKNSMHFYARWHEYNGIKSAGAKGVGGTDLHEDINFATLEGQGVYAGDAITIFNTADAWWGEGDEKVYVDGEAFPSHLGTGTEDYIGYAWCRPEPFSHFLIAQPDGSGNFHTGMTVNMRHRMLDGIPFMSSLKFDMELWHWAPTVMNYAVVSYCYMKPGGQNLTRFTPEAVKEKVRFTLLDGVKPVPDEHGILEGEHLRIVSASKGSWQVQTSTSWNWSKDRQLWWMDGGEGGKLIAEFDMPEEGKYQIEGVFTKAIDYGDFRLSINGNKASGKFSGYHDQTGGDVITQKVRLGKHQLNKGVNTIEIEITGKHRKAVDRWMVGIDCFKLTK